MLSDRDSLLWVVVCVICSSLSSGDQISAWTKDEEWRDGEARILYWEGLK